MTNLPDNFDHRAFEARYGDEQTRDLSEVAASYCLAKIAYAAGEDEAGDAAWGRLIDAFPDSDERDQVEAQLEQEYPRWSDWVACLRDSADFWARDRAKRGVVKFIQGVMQL
jgi:hypothetical protein